MKKLTAVIISLLLAVTFCVALSSCQNKGITSLSATETAITMQSGKSADFRQLITYEGSGELTYAAEGDCLSVSGSLVTALKVGQGKVTVYSDRLAVSIDVTVVDANTVNVNLLDRTVFYNGAKQSLSFEEQSYAPKSAKIEYFCNGEPFDGAVYPGVYNISVRVSGYGLTVNNIRTNAVLTVLKGQYDMSGIGFLSAVYDYDGEIKCIKLNGDLPQSLTVKYSVSQSVPNGEPLVYDGNSASDAGVYMIKAVFSSSDEYYDVPEPRTARLTINRKKFDFDANKFSDTTVKYNGDNQTVAIDNLPQGLTAEYYLVYTEGFAEKEKPIAEANCSEVGTYRIRAKFTTEKGSVFDKNYAAVADKTVILTVQKADFDLSELKWELSFTPAEIKISDALHVALKYVYDGKTFTAGRGTPFSFNLAGVMPKGVKNEYDGRISVQFTVNDSVGTACSDVGIYAIKAKFILDGYEDRYNPIPDAVASFQIVKREYDMKGVTFQGGEFVFNADAPYSFALNTAGTNFNAEDAQVKYYLTKLGAVKPVRVKADGSIKINDVGKYLIEAEFEYLKEPYLTNYTPIAKMSDYVEIKRLIIDADIFMENTYATYDGQAKSILIQGDIPDGVNAFYTGNGAIDAGKYTVKVNLTYKTASPSNYAIRVRGTIKDSLSATLTVVKADYKLTAEQIAGFSAADGIYNPLKTLADRAITGQNVFWLDPTIVPGGNKTSYRAYYNADRKNYNDYEFQLRSLTSPMDIDCSALTVNDQFASFSGERVQPRVELSGVDYINDIISIRTVCATDLTSIGAHRVTSIEISAKESYNYTLLNLPASFAEFTVNICEGKFVYEGTVLKKYNGNDISLTVPYGTTAVAVGAISSVPGLIKISFPDTVVCFGKGSCKNLVDLTEITLPFIGLSKGDGFSFGALFNCADNELPSKLVTVNVTDENIIYPGAYKGASRLTRVYYNKDILKVGENAFYGCSSLVTADFYKAVAIGKNALYGCLQLTELRLSFIGGSLDVPDVFDYLIGSDAGDNAYANYRIASLKIADGQKTIIDRTFAGLSSVTELVLPNTLQSLGKFAFESVSAPINITAPLKTLNQSCFSGYKGTAVTLPDTLTAIETSAFASASDLSEIVIPKDVASIGAYAFNGVKGKVTFKSDSAISVFSANAFSGYGGSTLIIPSGVKTLQSRCFFGSSILGITVPSTVEVVEEFAFASSLSLASVTLSARVVANNAFDGCLRLNSVTILDGVTEIGDYAFYNTALTSVTLPLTLTCVGSYAFASCAELTFIAVLGDTSLGEKFAESSAKVYVPKSKYAAFVEKYGNKYSFYQIEE